MRILTVTIGACALSALAAASGIDQTSEASAEKQLLRAGEMFRNGCITCHSAPDTRFATDRAWLTQVLDTA